MLKIQEIETYIKFRLSFSNVIPLDYSMLIIKALVY